MPNVQSNPFKFARRDGPTQPRGAEISHDPWKVVLDHDYTQAQLTQLWADLAAGKPVTARVIKGVVKHNADAPTAKAKSEPKAQPKVEETKDVPSLDELLGASVPVFDDTGFDALIAEAVEDADGYRQHKLE